ncbi:MAG: HAD family hydrolase [Candidatus Methylomirabilales bacterium]
MAQTILLFDIDGTLLSAGGADRRAVLLAFRELWGVDAAVDGVPVHGRTDLEIVEDIFRARMGKPPGTTELELLQERYVVHLEKELTTSPGFQILPGIPHLLEALSADPALALGLATGNVEEAAKLKLRRADLLEKFRFGAFGSDAADRETLLRVAIERGKATLTSPTDHLPVIVVGDTVLDITAGKRLGATTVAVATGGDSWTTLEAAAPDHLLPDLSQLIPFLTIIEGVQGGMQHARTVKHTED